VGLELLEMLAADNLSVGKWCPAANASGISISELLAALGDDDRIKVIAIYLEGLRTAGSSWRSDARLPSANRSS